MEKARELQRQRFAGRLGGAEGNVPLLCNADTSALAAHMQVWGRARCASTARWMMRARACRLRPAICWAGLRAAMTQLGMSARAFHRILKLARTIADLEGAGEIQTHHLAEAIQYRPRRQL